jgi:hypothetical protein
VAAISTKAPTTSGFGPLGEVWFDADGELAKSGSCQDDAFFRTWDADPEIQAGYAWKAAEKRKKPRISRSGAVNSLVLGVNHASTRN